MSTITFPDALAAAVGDFSWTPMENNIDFKSPFGPGQAVGISAPQWMASVSQSTLREINAGAWQALVMKLKGRVNTLELWNIMRPVPVGTMRGTMTLSGAHSQGAASLVIAATGQSGTTLKAGDYLGLGAGATQQVVMVLDDATANSSGITVNIGAALRNAFSNGAAVTWNKPKALFRQRPGSSPWKYGRGQIVIGIALDLIEDWRS